MFDAENTDVRWTQHQPVKWKSFQMDALKMLLIQCLINSS
jgi:hypothetical protein